MFDRGFQLGDGMFETLRVRASHPTELAEHVARLRRSATGLDISLPADIDAQLARGIAELLAANGLDGHDGDASVRITISRGAHHERGLLPAGEVGPRNDRDPGLAGRASAGRRISSAGCTSSPPQSVATRPIRWSRSRPRHAPTTSTHGSRRAGRALTTRSS